MTTEILQYYNEELDYLRNVGNEFAKAHPKIAGSLRMDQQGIDDPMVARLVESFAFLNAKTSKQIDSDNVELAHALLNLLYPNLLLPVPSLSTVQFSPRDKLDKPAVIVKNMPLVATTVNQQMCQFRTCYPLTIYPLTVVKSQLVRSSDLSMTRRSLSSSKACIRIELKSTNAKCKLSSLDITVLRFFINAQKHYANRLYEVIFNQVVRVVVYSPETQQSVELDPEVIHTVGFEQEEALLPYPKTSFDGFRLLTEFSVFTDKFMYFDIEKISGALTELKSDNIEILLSLNQYHPDLEAAIHDSTFQLGCTPVINLFPLKSEEITIDHLQSAYRISADKTETPWATEVYEVRSVSALIENGESIPMSRLYGNKYGFKQDGKNIYWEAQRKPAWHFGALGKGGCEVMLRFIENDSMLTEQSWRVTADLLCTNRNLPSDLPFGGGQPVLSISNVNSSAAVEADKLDVKCLRQPTISLRPPLDSTQYWQLLSMLVSAQESIMDLEFGLDNLKSILLGLDVSHSDEIALMLEHMHSLSSKSITARYPHAKLLTFVRGIQLTIDFKIGSILSQELFLFGTVLSNFLNQYCALDSFIELRFTMQHKGEIAKWKPQFGALNLV
jgi:type VI secretion system protein ImpG